MSGDLMYRLLVLTTSLLVACDTLECGTGTHREQDRCVPNVQVTCGDGTTFRDGRCVGSLSADAGDDAFVIDAGLTCGPGTHEEDGVCVPDEASRDAGPDAEATDALPTDGMVVDSQVPDMMEEPPPRCPPELTPGAPPADCGALPPGSYCITGVATEFLTGCALPSDQGLAILVIDPVAVAGGATPQEAARGQGLVGPNGTFAIQGTGAATQLAMVIDEAPMVPANTWTRSVSGVSAAQPTPGQIFRVAAFATKQATQAVWNDALGLDPQGLETGGFLLGRVLAVGDGGLVPTADARVRLRMNSDALDCAEGRPCLRFFDDNPALTGFQPVGAGATGRSGAFLLRLAPPPAPNVLQDVLFVDRQEETYAPLPAGAARGSGFHTAFVPM